MRRRSVPLGALAIAISLIAAPALIVTPAAAAAPTTAVPAVADPSALDLTLLATTDVHGHVYNWDYFANAPYTRPADVLGLTRTATVVKEKRVEKGADSVVVLDNGDAIQGTPLTYYYGMGPGRADVLSGAVEHPMATAFNGIGYDAQVLGNHEFNYGRDLLGVYEDSLHAPLLGANVVNAGTDEPAFTPYTLIERTIDGHPVTIGVLGLVTPGVRIWDKANVDGVLEFHDMVAAAKKWTPIVQQQADVVVVLAHTGTSTIADQDYDSAQLYENTVNNIATQVSGIDVIVSGHTHQDRPQTVYQNPDGGSVLVTQPNYWARSVSEVSLSLVPAGDGWAVDWTNAPPTVTPHYGKDIAAEDPTLSAELLPQHRTTIDYVNTVIAASATELSAATSRYEDTPILDFINRVQTDTVTDALAGTPYAGLPVLSQASPFSRTATFAQGDVTIRDMAALYVFDNTLRAVTITGAELRDYLEYSANYFTQTEAGAAFDPATGTNAVTDYAPTGIPDYNYDVLSGVNYTIDVSQPGGQRIAALTLPNGTAVQPTDRFVLASNNYRQSGGGDYPHIAAAPVVYDEQQEIRQLLIDWASVRGTIDPADFFMKNWAVVTEPLAAVPEKPSDPIVGPLVPETTVSSGSRPDANDTTRTGSLASTGTTVDGAIPLGLALLGLGGALVLARRLRPHASRRTAARG